MKLQGFWGAGVNLKLMARDELVFDVLDCLNKTLIIAGIQTFEAETGFAKYHKWITLRR